MLLFANNADSTLKNPALAAHTTLYLADGTGGRFPLAGGGNTFFVTLIDLLGNVEIVEVTNRAGDVLTVERARDGTTAKSFPAGSVVDHRVVAEVLRRMSPDALRGANDGLAPLDADGRIPEAYLPTTLMTETIGDARYLQLANANVANGYLQLDAGAKVAMDRLPGELLTLAEGDAAYIKVSAKGAAGGVATLDADGKLPVGMFNSASVDLSPYAPLAGNPNFVNGLTAGGTATFAAVSVTGAATFGDIDAATLDTTGVVTVMGGAPRGKLTFSTSPPSGTPGEGDEWVQHEA